MTSLTRALCGAVSVLGLTAVLAGCGGPDNDTNALTGPDGTPIKIEGSPAATPTASSYNDKSKAQAAKGAEGLQGKTYPKR